MREICQSGSEGGAAQTNALSLPLSFADNLKQADAGSVHLSESAQVQVRNSIFWESYDGALAMTDGSGDVNDSSDARRKHGITFGSALAAADVSSSLFSLYPTIQTVLSGNLSNTLEPYFDTFGNYVRRRCPGHLDPDAAAVVDGVTSLALNTATGNAGPLGYRRHLRIDLEGRARALGYRKVPLTPAPLTTADIGCLEAVSNLALDDAYGGPGLGDLVSVSNGLDTQSRTSARLAVSVPRGGYLGYVFTIDQDEGGGCEGFGGGAPEPLTLTENPYFASELSLAFDGTANRLYGFEDQRRGWAFDEENQQDPSGALGCVQLEDDPLPNQPHWDYHEAVLRGCNQLIPANASPGVSNLLLTPESTNKLEDFLASGSPADSPYRYQPSGGLRAELRKKLAATQTSLPAATYQRLIPDHAFPDGILIAMNTVPKFGQPLNGTTYVVTDTLPYDGGGPTTTAGQIVYALNQPYIPAEGEKSAPITAAIPLLNPPAGGSAYVHFRAWPFSGNGAARVYGPPFDASLKVIRAANGSYTSASDSEQFPLVINEVMPGSEGWIELFNTSGEQVSGSTVQGVKLFAGDNNASDGSYKLLTGMTFSPRSHTVFAAAPQSGEFLLAKTFPEITLEQRHYIEFRDASDQRIPSADRNRCRNRLEHVVSEGRLWDGGPRGQREDDVANSQPAAFSGTALTNPEHPVTRKASNTQGYNAAVEYAPSDSVSYTYRQPYFQAVVNKTRTQVWVFWRNIGYTGAVWDGDGRHHDFCSCRVEGSAYKTGTLYAGLRAPLSNRTAGNAFVLSFPASNALTTSPTGSWPTFSGSQALHQINLGGQGVRALQWSSHAYGGSFLIVSGPQGTDPAADHPSVGRYALWSWDGTNAPVLRIRDLAPYCLRPTGVCTFAIPGTPHLRIAFSSAQSTTPQTYEEAHISHWPLSILPP